MLFQPSVEVKLGVPEFIHKWQQLSFYLHEITNSFVTALACSSEDDRSAICPVFLEPEDEGTVFSYSMEDIEPPWLGIMQNEHSSKSSRSEKGLLMKPNKLNC